MEFSFESELDLENRVVAPDYNPEDAEVENPLYPRQLSECIGQQKVKGDPAMFMEAAKQRKGTPDHVLLYSPPGLDKTTSAGIITDEVSVGVRITSGPVIEKLGDLAAILTDLSPDNVLLIDKIYRLSRSVKEILYPAMGDFVLDITTGKGRMAASYHLSLPPFTLVGAAVHAGQPSAPLCNRFGAMLWLELYSPEEFAQIVTRNAGVFGIPIEPGGTLELAPRPCGIPRIANRLLRRMRNSAQVVNDEVITIQAVRRMLERLEVDEIDLDASDRRMLRTTIGYYRGGPMGLDALAAAIGEESAALEDVYEPYPIQTGSLSRTPRGHCVTRSAYLHLGLTPPKDLTGT